MNDINGKEYKTGKAFHIYRPHIIDAEGKETWGILNIENGIYSVEIPQEFLDKAVYPIKSNDTFGYTTAGGSSAGWSNAICSSPKESVTGGTVSSISVSCRKFENNVLIKGNVYNSTYAPLGSTGENTVTNTSQHWETLSYSSSPTVVSGNSYFATAWGENVLVWYYDSMVSTDIIYQSITYTASWPNPVNHSNYTNKISIYATYTPLAGNFFQLFN
jgi:hypothetical protein